MYLETQYRNRFKIASKGRVLLVTSAMLLGISLAHAAPTGGVVSSGNAVIGTSGTATTVDQTSSKVIINWQDFSIAENESVTFRQPDASSIALNRVVGSNRSVLEGVLNANGKVYLVNTNGILISKDATVNTAGFLASTRNITDENFKKENFVFDADGSQGNVVNLGTIEVSEGGYVVLLGRQVSNEGTILATKGTVAMASGDKITLNFNGNSLVDVTIDEGTLDALVETKQAIVADGGTVILTAKAADELLSAQVNIEGLVQAQTIGDLKGEIIVYADGGTTTVSGTLDASAPTAGEGGFIETSGDTLKIADNAVITTKAVSGSGTWLIDPKDFTIGRDGDISGANLSHQLANNNVLIEAASGLKEGEGNIYVNDTVAWHTNTLTLDAENSIYVNNEMSATGNASFEAIYGSGTNSDGSSNGIYMAFGATGSFAGKLNFEGTGSVTLGGKAYYIINSVEQLQNMVDGELVANNPSGPTHYVLGNDIDLSSVEDWETLDVLGIDFNGLGHIVSNLKSTSGGLFGSVKGGSITNTGVVNADITTENSAGILAGESDMLSPTHLSNVFTTGKIDAGTVDSANVGGLMGFSTGRVYNAYSTAEVIGGATTDVTSANVGGLLGVSGSYVVSDSWFSGTVKYRSALTVGGLIGHSGGLVRRSYSTGDVFNYDENVYISNGGIGGLIGRSAALQGVMLMSDRPIEDSFATGNVSYTAGHGGGIIGGFVGYSDRRYPILNSYATGDVTGTPNSGVVGGFIGQIGSGVNSSNMNRITNAYATGDVSGGEYAGGFAGKNGSRSEVRNAYATGSVSGSQNAGGFVGANSGTLTNVYWDKDASGIQTDGGTATGLSASEAKDIANYAGFDLSIWGTSSNGSPILITIPLRIASLTKTYGDTISLDDFTVYGLQGGDSVSDVLTYDDSGYLSSSARLNARAYQAGDLLNVSNYLNVRGGVLIQPKAVTTTSMEVRNKIYDSTLDAELNGQGEIADGVLSGDDVLLGEGTAYFADKNAGNEKTVYVNYSLKNTDGSVNSNYIAQGTTTATITPKIISATFEANDKVYDGTTSATVSSSNSGAYADDDVILSWGNVNFSDKNAGDYKIVTLSGLSLSGEDSGNYMLNSETARSLATITPLALAINGTKHYDGSTAVDVNDLTAINVVPGDNVNISGNAILAGSDTGTQQITNFDNLSIDNPNYTLDGAIGYVNVGNTNLQLNQVASGEVNVNTENRTTTITQTSNKAIVDWLKFSIASDETVNFVQPDSASIILNRVVGDEKSIIEGALNANGRVFILNANGVLFSSTSTVNTAALLASTSSINNEDFLNSNYAFKSNGAAGNIINEGDIVIVDGGFAAFIGENDVENKGNVTAPNGDVVLASTNEMTLYLDSNNNLGTYAISDVSKTATASGTITTDLLEVAGKDAVIDDGLVLETGSNGKLSLTKESINVGEDISGEFVENQLTLRSLALNSLVDDLIVNDSFDWSRNTLTLSSAKNIWINNVLNATNNNFTGIYGEGTNSDGTNYGLYTKMGENNDGTFVGKINFGSSYGAVYLGTKDNLEKYTVIKEDWELYMGLEDHRKRFVLGNDLDFSHFSNWTPMELYATLNGMGHVVENLTSKKGGMFSALSIANYRPDWDNPLENGSGPSYIWDGMGTLSNFGVRNANITFTPTKDLSNSVGGLVGYNNGLITNTFATGTMTAVITENTELNFGGLVADNRRDIFNSYSNMDMTINGGAGYQRAGGFVGTNRGLIQGSHAIGTITAYGGNFIGGFAGLNQYDGNLNEGANLINDYADVDIFLHGGTIVGGFIGANMGTSYIYGSYALGDITGETTTYDLVGSENVANIGGFAGVNTEFSVIDNSYAEGDIDVTGTDGRPAGNNVGGFVGLNGYDISGIDGSIITNSYATGNVKSTGNYVGGFAGRTAYGTLIDNSYSTGDVVGNDYVGGFIGMNGLPVWEMMFETGDTPGGYFETVIDHITFHNSNYSLAREKVVTAMARNGATISNSHSSGTVQATAENATAGAFAGENGYGGNINDSYVTGDGMSQANGAGMGLVGANGRGDDYISDALGADAGTSTVSNTSFGSPTEQAQWAAEALALAQREETATHSRRNESAILAQAHKDNTNTLNDFLALLSGSASKQENVVGNIDTINPKYETDVKAITVDGVTYNIEESDEDEKKKSKKEH